MRLLDLFCGAGGCSVGYQRAGFDVVGVDIAPHDDYPFQMHVMDAFDSTSMWPDFDVIHASPPCPAFSAITPDRTRHADLLTPMLALLRQWDGVWVVENVPGAPMPDPVLYCGQAMGLPMIRRHRLFSSNAPMMSPGCACGSHEVVGVYGRPGPYAYKRPGTGESRGIKYRNLAHGQQVMGIDWMTSMDDLTDAIPPAYTEHIGWQLIDHLERAS